MDVKLAIQKRRAYRSLTPTEITDDIVKDLAECASLSPSCFNKQPWRYVFVYDPEMLKQIHSSIKSGNEWVHQASLIIAVFSKKDLDCIIKEREYFLFDVGMATAFIILRSTELGLVAHPIAGFSERKVKEILKIPEEMTVITLVCIGKKAEELSTALSEKQMEAEKERPTRKSTDEFVFVNGYT